MKYGIMGGTFSPIHIGHLILAEEVLHQYSLDKILFIPSGRPPHKEESAGSKDRLKMVELAIRDNPRFMLSDIEVSKKSQSYTVETVRQLKIEYPEDTFYFITGADALTTLDQWHDFRELARSIVFIGANRPGIPELGVRKKVESLRSIYDFKIELVEIPSIAVSSSEIRRRVNLEKTIRYMVPRAVEDYISEKGLYICRHPLYFKMLKATKNQLSEKRFLHSCGVAAAARRLAIRFGQDYQKAELAGLLHDFCKEIGRDESKKLVEKYGILQHPCIRQNPGLAHGEIAAGFLKEKGFVEDEEILEAVRWHTYGNEVMSELSKIVYIADIIEEHRADFPGREEVRAASQESLDAAISAWRPFDEAKEYAYPPHPNARKMFDAVANARKEQTKEWNPREIMGNPL